MRNPVCLTVFAITGALALSSCAVFQAAPPAPEPEHYVCSDFKVDNSSDVGIEWAGLQDQFGKTKVELRLVTYLCAPANKRHDGKDTRAKDLKGPHLACYEFVTIKPDTDIGKAVRITNQFEKNGLKATVGKRKFLCVPSSKIEIRPGEEPRFDRDKEIERAEKALNHFVCSELSVAKEDFNRKRLDIPMADQFGPFEGPILMPDYICAPAAKSHGATRKNPQGGFNAKHLVCYKFVEDRNVGLPAKVLVINQLGSQQGTPTKRFMFCAPSDKKVL
jgi:hypothetical protein